VDDIVQKFKIASSSVQSYVWKALPYKWNKKIKTIRDRIPSVREYNPRKAQRLRRAWYRAEARSSNMVSDFHWKVIKYLLDSFDVILAPRLNVQGLLKTKLDQKNKQRMLDLRHGQFTQRLKMKAEARKKKVIVDFEEHGTSVTCSNCGEANRNLKEFQEIQVS